VNSTNDTLRSTRLKVGSGELRTWLVRWPLGTLAFAASVDGVVAVDLRATRPVADASLDTVLARSATNEVEIIEGSPEPRVHEALVAYVKGDHDAFVELPVDLGAATPFAAQVYDTLRYVRAGQLVSYGALANACGRPGAARAIGRIVGANPLPLIVPCHRVVAADGSLGGFSGGLGVKRWLLAHEGVAARPGGWQSRRRPVC